MTALPTRWRGPRRPDIELLRGAQTARSNQQQTRLQPLAVTQRSLSQQDDLAPSTSFAAASSTSSSAFPFATTTIHAVSSHEDASSASHHFKYNYLSAGRFDAATAAKNGGAGLRVNRRPGIMDSTRSFESDGVVDMSAAAKSSRAVAAASRDHAAASLGYGTQHPAHFDYLSKELPPRVTESFDERPCVFPTVELPPLETRPASHLESLTFREQKAYQAPFKSRVASGLGYGSKQLKHSAYLANTYWRKMREAN